MKAKRLPPGAKEEDDIADDGCEDDEDDDERDEAKKTNKTSKISKNLSDLVNIISAVHFHGFDKGLAKALYMYSLKTYSLPSLSFR